MNVRKLRALPFLVLLLPLDLAVTVLLLLASVFGRSRHPRTDGKSSAGVSGGRATILVLNWDGKHLLADGLPSVLEAVRASGGNHRVLVVDNGSTDGSVAFVRERFPDVQILELDRNYGFVAGNNKGMAAVETEIVVLLNNDMIVERGFLQPLLDGFRDPSVFAVTSQIFFEDRSRRREETGKTRAKYESGFFTFWHDDISDDDEQRSAIPVFWAGGGSCAIDRNKYLEIGGLDDLYHPFYVEDADLSYRAWKRGWKCVLAPASRVIHKHRATSSRKFSHRFVDNTIRRNLFLFVWKNVTDLPMILEHVVHLPSIHGRAMIHDSAAFEVKAYLRAVLRLPAALQKRLRSACHCRVSDREILFRSRP